MSQKQLTRVRQPASAIEPTVDTLLSELRDPDANIRQQAARTLGDAADAHNEPVIARLLAALHDEEESVRIAAAGALEKLGRSADSDRERRWWTSQLSGGADVSAKMVTIGSGVVGRDKIVVLEANEDQETRATSAYYTGTRLAEQGHWYEGLALLEESLNIRRRLDNLDARADAIYQIARIHHLIGNLDKARTCYRDAMRLYARTENQLGIAACKTGLGHLMTQTGFAHDAIAELESARRIYRRLGNNREVSKVNEALQIATHVKERQLA
jgi:tetratricopeptide (TPR) repeat protein